MIEERIETIESRLTMVPRAPEPIYSGLLPDRDLQSCFEMDCGSGHRERSVTSRKREVKLTARARSIVLPEAFVAECSWNFMSNQTGFARQILCPVAAT